MPVYKIPQNVEAEDKLLGPFTFKQFLFLIITAIAGLLAWGLWNVNPVLVIIPLPIILIFGFLGVYHREDQPVETYLLAALNFMLRPKKRVWSQEGIPDNVEITAPKRQPLPRVRTQEEYTSQLKKLAEMLDTRGLTAKESVIQLPTETSEKNEDDDRLFMPKFDQTTSKTVQVDVKAEDDILDPDNTTVMQNFRKLAEDAAKKVRDQAVERMREKPETPKPGNTILPTNTIPANDKKTLADDPNVKYDPFPAMHQRKMNPETGEILMTGKEQEEYENASISTINTMTPASLDAILELSKNDDLKVSQIAAQAQRRQQQFNQPQYGPTTNPATSTPTT
jgi:hypothetical protein